MTAEALTAEALTGSPTSSPAPLTPSIHPPSVSRDGISDIAPPDRVHAQADVHPDGARPFLRPPSRVPGQRRHRGVGHRSRAHRGRRRRHPPRASRRARPRRARRRARWPSSPAHLPERVPVTRPAAPGRALRLRLHLGRVGRRAMATPLIRRRRLRGGGPDRPRVDPPRGHGRRHPGLVRAVSRRDERRPARCRRPRRRRRSPRRRRGRRRANRHPRRRRRSFRRRRRARRPGRSGWDRSRRKMSPRARSTKFWPSHEPLAPPKRRTSNPNPRRDASARLEAPSPPSTPTTARSWKFLCPASSPTPRDARAECLRRWRRRSRANSPRASWSPRRMRARGRDPSPRGRAGASRTVNLRRIRKDPSRV